MVTVVTVKLTQEELDVLEWLARRGNLESRSAALRFALRTAAAREGVAASEIRQIDDSRRTHRPRRSAEIARLVGRRRPGGVGEQSPLV